MDTIPPSKARVNGIANLMFSDITPRIRRDLSRQMNDCSFFIGDRPDNRVNSYVHLGHILSVNLMSLMMLDAGVIVSLDSLIMLYVILINWTFW